MNNPTTGSGILAMRVYEHCLAHTESFEPLPHIAYLMAALLKGTHIELDGGVTDDATFLDILRKDEALFQDLQAKGAIKPIPDE